MQMHVQDIFRVMTLWDRIGESCCLSITTSYRGSPSEIDVIRSIDFLEKSKSDIGCKIECDKNMSTVI